ncbi:hypothetical protein C7Y72_17895 [Paraconexibacter algicola]|uniref:Uncharacterized protein n=2 Tax=Paraconexibacter algicola TaxID=2133960 RepID=A0A2T4UDL5_9ACTN|nr:hypothetical protein C7Y72_17895 [Paraconexibacter algicola]
MLRRASGGRTRTAKPYRRAQFEASLNQIVKATQRIESELRSVLPQQRKGTRDYREEAERILGVIDRTQERLTQRRAQARYWAQQGAWGRITEADREKAKIAVATSRELTKLRRRAKRAVAVPIAVSIPNAPRAPRKGPAAKRRRWTAEGAWVALIEWTAKTGAPPRAVDFRNEPSLPSYAKVHEFFGGLSALADDLIDDAAYYKKTGHLTASVVSGD